MTAIDLVVFLIVVTCSRSIASLAEAASQRLLLRARGELARAVAGIPPGVEMAGRDRDGASWLIRDAGCREGRDRD